MASGCTIWNVVVPPLMMIGSPSSQSSTAARAMACFCAMLIFSLTKTAARQADKLRRRDRLGPAAHPAQLLSAMQVAMSRRTVASEASVRCTQIRNRHDRAILNGGQMILWRSVLVHVVLPWLDKGARNRRIVSITIVISDHAALQND